MKLFELVVVYDVEFILFCKKLWAVLNLFKVEFYIIPIYLVKQYLTAQVKQFFIIKQT